MTTDQPTDEVRTLRFVYVTMDGNHNAALREAAHSFREEHGMAVQLGLYSMAGLRDPADWERLQADVDRADFVFGSMIFGEEHVRPLVAMLKAASAPMCFITSNPALIYCTRVGKLDMSSFQKDPDAEEKEPGLFKRWLGKLRPKKEGRSEGYRQTALIKNLTRLMKYVPGKLRDLHTFIAMHDYWIHSSPENLKRQMALLAHRYIPGCEHIPAQDAVQYADLALYHPDADAPFTSISEYVAWRKATGKPVTGSDNPWKGAVGVMSMRAIILSGNTAPLDHMIRELEAQGLEARATYSAMLDFRPAMEAFYSGGKASEGLPHVDALMNAMGFPLVGGPAGSRPEQAVAALGALDVGYFDLVPLGFQSVNAWRDDAMGLNPMQVAMNIALPELDGSTEPVIYGGPLAGRDHFHANSAEVGLAARRVERRVRLRRKDNADKKLALVLFNFPPNLGNIGTAAFLDVFESVYRLLAELRDSGYAVELPASADDLRRALTEGNAVQYGTDGNVAARLSLDEYRRRFPWYDEIEAYWGSAPGDLLTDGRDFYILGAQFGSVFIGIQPSFGYERDPMRLLMGKDASPHHGFAAFYTWLDQVYDADAVLHVGTHGALEFMPGKQIGITADCWPSRLLGGLPNVYYYCVNNPSEGSIAKRRSAATLVSYMVPPVQQAGLYKGLRRLKDSIDMHYKRADAQLFADIQAQAEALGITVNAPANASSEPETAYLAALNHELIQLEQRMIPLGLHVLGQPPAEPELVDMLALAATFHSPMHPQRSGERLPPLPALIAQGLGHDYAVLRDSLKTDPAAQVAWSQIDTILREAVRLFISEPGGNDAAADAYLHAQTNLPQGLLDKLWAYLADLNERIIHDQEISGLLHALDGGYIHPSPGNDVVRNDAIVPTGRNIHALDPYRVPNSSAVNAATALVTQMLENLEAENGALPETVAMVLWGTDNLKSDGEGIAQCLALLGALPVEDELGNVSDVKLIPLAELGRPRIDVVMTLSGIFRDLFHYQAGLLDKAVRLAATADEPLTQNFVRKHTLEHAEAMGVSLEAAAARVFSNAPGAYGANVNHLVESSTWDEDDQLSEAFMLRKSYAYQPGGGWEAARDVMERSLATVGAAFQNIDSFEMGISDVDHYYEYLGGVAKSVEKLRGVRPPVLVADPIATEDRLASLEQMVRLESRAKMLNPKWYDAMLDHGYEGVREIELRVSNTYGWSATADAVEGWVYDDVAATYLLDEVMRARMAAANPHATAGIARRLLEAEARGFWEADDALIEQLREIYGNLEDQLEGVALAPGAD